MDIKLDLNPNIQEVLSAAVFSALGQESREKIMRQAVDYLLTPRQDGVYSRKTSPLIDALNHALEVTARRMVEDMLASDETISASIRAMIREAMEKAITDKRSIIVDKVAEAFAKCLNPSDRD